MAKKVTAPKTHNPGKGRPKEHLAYLNEREMAYLRSLNGNNMERGPRGIPSFADDSASSRGVSRGDSSGTRGSSGSTSSRGSGPGGPNGPNSGPSTNSGGGGGSGGLGQGGQGGAGPAGPSGPNSGPSRGAGGQSSNLGGGGQGNSPRGPSGPNSGPSASVGGGQRGAGSNYGYGSARPGTPAKMDDKVIQAAQVRDARQAVSSPALNRDLRVGGISTLSVGPIGTTVKVGKPVASGMSYNPTQEAGKISKSISAARAAQPGMVGPVAISSLAQPPGYSTTFNAQNQINALRDVMQSQIGFGDQAFTSNPNEVVRHLAGEVGTSGVGAGQVAQTMVNRSLVANAPSLPQYDNSLANRRQWASIGNPAYNAATPGGAIAGQVANQAIKEMMSGVPAPNATDFRAVNQPGGVKTQKVGTDVAGNRFGNFEGVSAEQVAALRAANPIASQFSRVAQAPTPSAQPSISRAVSIKSDLGFTPSAQAETAPTGPLMSGAKPIQDRIISSITPSGGIYSQPLSSIQDTWRKAGYSEADIKKSTDALMNSPTNVAADRYNVLSGISAPAPQSPRSTAGTYTQPYDRSSVVPTGNPNMAGASLNAPLRGPAGTYTAPYEPRNVVPTGNPNMAGAPISQPAKIGSKIGTEYFGPQQYNQPIPSPTSMDILGDAAAPGTVAQAEQFKNLINSYTASIPSFKSMTQAYADLQPSVQRYQLAEKLLGRQAADKLAIKAAESAGVSAAVSQGIKSLGGMVEKGLVGALSGQAALARAGVAPVPNVDLEGPQRAKETVESAEGPKFDRVEVVGGLGAMATYAPTAPISMSAKDLSPEERDIVYNGPDMNTVDLTLGKETPEETVPSDDVYGPKYVSPEVQQEMADIDKYNQYGAKVVKAVPIVGPVARAADFVRGLFTGKTTTEADADLKRAYMQGDSAQRAQLEAAYPNLTKFAQQVGLRPQLPMSNYENWRQTSFGTLGQDRSERPDRTGNSQVASGRDGARPRDGVKPVESGRPQIYYMWDVGVNIPSPSDSNYTLYQQYLAERDAAYG